MNQPLIQRRPQPELLPELPGVPPVLQRIYASRGITQPAELDRTLRGLPPFSGMRGITAACEQLARAMREQKQIVICGDFDADGATSTTLSVLALQQLGAARVTYLVPNRFEYGYGLSPEIVQQAIEAGAELIMTVDSGISCHAGVEAAKAAGLTVVVTDHHLPGEKLPPADAIVNPNQPGCQFPSRNLAGVGVAFYLMLALRAHLRDQGWFAAQQIPEPNLADLLDIVALGTVADVVPLDSLNRVLVHQGLLRIRAGRCRPGIAALVEVAGRNRAAMVASDLGFALGPRLNAAGRLDDMGLGISCLLCDDPGRAREIASELDSLNRERREIEHGMQQEALEALEALDLEQSSDTAHGEQELPWSLCLYQEDWHQGVIGILASRIKERFHRPTIIFAAASESEIKGSARSVPGLHMRDLLEHIDSRHPGLISKFGGHAMAAGLSIPSENFERFKAEFEAGARQMLSEEQLTGVILSDGELAPHELSMELALTLRDGGPWGQAFAEPVFDGVFRVVQQRMLGKEKNHLKLVLMHEQGGQSLDAIAFNVDTRRWPDASLQWIKLAYRLDINEFRGRQSVQLMIEALDSAIAQ